MKTITLDDDLYESIATLARPFRDKEPADVIRRLVDGALNDAGTSKTDSLRGMESAVLARAPRERGAIIELDGARVQADSVPDLCMKVMQFMYENGHWGEVVALAPYKTSAQRYLFSKTPKHPNGNDFFVELKYRGLYIEAHKNYQTAIRQLTKFAAKCGVKLSYKGS